MATATEAPASHPAEGQTSHTQNQADGLAKLRADFPTEQIQHLPRLKCGACRDSKTGICANPRHAKSECKECGNYISAWHLHLDYVGHAELTNRLLDADPLWDWEPVAFDQRGLPAFDDNGGLWIRLTVCGHTRLGYGDAQGKRGPNAVKEAIGDALRNAAMRFGAALDLWAKSDLREAQAEHPKSAEDEGRPAYAEGERPASQQNWEDPLPRLMAQIANCWDNQIALLQIRIDGKQKGVSDRDVQGPPPEHAATTFDTLLEGRIEELKQAAQGGTTEGSAA
ncbi:hypothetical protein [Streptomyces europaeiscabiei]|uniref:hypothetical protein n=1 Tax=Streptomyces europaeiscabiei TaxID=146819 RepID=UPI002E25EC30|nr:hypothetical protein OG858_47700 [Streptomyces europaeiscabiei]